MVSSALGSRRNMSYCALTLKLTGTLGHAAQGPHFILVHARHAPKCPVERPVRHRCLAHESTRAYFEEALDTADGGGADCASLCVLGAGVAMLCAGTDAAAGVW